MNTEENDARNLYLMAAHTIGELCDAAEDLLDTIRAPHGGSQPKAFVKLLDEVHHAREIKAILED